MLVVSRTCRIPMEELHWTFSASGGPGGQHANTSNTRAEVRFDVAASPSLGPRQKARLVEKLGPVVRVAAQDERSQSRNRALALERLRDRLAAALRVDPPRRPTRVPRGVNEARLEAKHRQSQRKQQRSSRPTPTDPD